MEGFYILPMCWLCAKVNLMYTLLLESYGTGNEVYKLFMFVG